MKILSLLLKQLPPLAVELASETISSFYLLIVIKFAAKDQICDGTKIEFATVPLSAMDFYFI